jgi:hypothetical protein
VDKNILRCFATSAGHVAGTEAMSSRKYFTRETGSDHSRDQDVEGTRKMVTGYWVDSFSFRTWTASSSYEHGNQDIS